MTKKYILAIDQGTSSSKAILYDLEGAEQARSAYEYSLSYPSSGWVEVDPAIILKTQFDAIQDILKNINPKEVAAIGITNQRETIVAWDKNTGEVLAPGIVWQCRRTAEFCNQIKNTDQANIIQEKTGLTIDPYFSASKIKWLIENNVEIKSKYDRDQVTFGTIDSWLIYNLTKSTEPCFYTDSSNASRTMLYNLKTNDWDQELLNIFNIKHSSLSKVKASNAFFGQVQLFGLDAPIMGVLGDQQSSLFGHGAYNSNDLKCTFGTGAFLLCNTGSEVLSSRTGLLSTVAWSIEKNNKIEMTYALEGSVFIAGSLIQWLRDQLGFIQRASEIEDLALKVNDSAGAVIVPAFVGLGSPYWDSSARGSILGLTANISKEHLAYAALEAVAHQVADLTDLQELNSVKSIYIDGGMIENNLFNQILANLTQREVFLANSPETTAYGAFLIAAYGANFLNPFQKQSRDNKSYQSNLSQYHYAKKRSDWQKAIEKSRAWVD